jgi:hypothetical protein
MASLSSGEEHQPIRAQRRLRKLETVVRIWDAAANPGESTLVFETDDGVLWQLCDVGLGWTRYVQPGPDWELNSRLAPHLPSRFNPRPGAPGSWTYEFELSSVARLTVRLSSRHPRKFVWALQGV